MRTAEQVADTYKNVADSLQQELNRTQALVEEATKIMHDMSEELRNNKKLCELYRQQILTMYKRNLVK